jgi:hypothetical protein
MNLVTNIQQYNEDYVYFLEPIKNNIIHNGQFIRIVYSTSLFTLNGIYINIAIKCHSIEKYYNKFCCHFDTVYPPHKELIDQLRCLEEGILRKTKIVGKTPKLKISEQFKHGHVKVFSDTLDQINQTFVLKIAGIWETDTEYGLTYKLIP